MHFCVPQTICQERHFSYESKDFVEYKFEGREQACGVDGHTYGSIINQLTPEKKTVLFTHVYWTSQVGTTESHEIDWEYFEDFDTFAKKNDITFYGTRYKMKELANRKLLKLSKYSDIYVEIVDC